MGHDVRPFEPAPWVGEHGPANRAERGIGARPGDDEHASIGHGHFGDCGRRHRRPRHAARSSGGQRTGTADERISERKVEMDRPRRLGGSQGDGARPERAPRVTRRLVRHARVGEPAHRPAVQVGLVDRLRRADIAQFRRTIGRAHEQRHLAEMGLDDGRMQVCRRGSAGREDDGRHTRRGTDAQRGKTRGALVVEDVNRQLCSFCECERHRGGPRPRCDNRVAHTGPHPFIDQGGRERRLRRHGSVRHPSIFVQV